MSPAWLALTIGALSLAAVAAPPPPHALARLTYVEHAVEQGDSGSWRPAQEGGALQIGEQVRTASGAVLQIDFPWMAVTVSSSSILHFPDAPFLQGVLAQGRVALRAEHRDILKLVTEEAEVRGQGHVVVRRQGQSTLVSGLTGHFSVEGAASVVNVPAGTGTIVRAGQPPRSPIPLPAPPDGLVPGTDPIYVGSGKPVRLRWNGRASAYHVEVLAVGSETVLIEQDVAEPTAELAIRWPGAFRWHVASRDPSGLEGPPSRDGFICVAD
jgi:hypothetical protein